MFLAWNVFFTATEFFSFRFNNSSFSANYANYFSFGFMMANMAFVTLATVRQHKADFVRQVVLSSVGNFLIFLGLGLLALWPDLTSAVSFYISLFLFFMSGITCAYMQNACFAISARWEPIYVQAICSGQGFSGAATALAPLLVTLLADQKSLSDKAAISTRAIIVFSLCAAVIVISFVCFMILMRMDIYRYYMKAVSFNEWGFEKQPVRIQGQGHVDCDKEN